MTDSSSYRKEYSEEQLPFDPENSQKADPELYWKAKEAEQSHQFRSKAFSAGLLIFGVVLLIWVILMANAPANDAPPTAFHLWMLKLSLCTILLGTVAIGLLRFAIQCYGHHQKAVVQDSKVPVVLDFAKIAEVAAKSASSSAP